MKTNNEKDHLAKIFQIAIFFFATTIGIGLYALIGAPIRQSGISSYFVKVGKLVNSASAGVVDLVKTSKTAESSGEEIVVKLSKPTSDFQVLKTTLIEAKLIDNMPTIVKFELDGREIGIPELFSYLNETKPSSGLLRIMGDSRYYVTNNKNYNGSIVVSLLDSEIAFASLFDWESKLEETTLPLVHPMFSKNDVSMYMKLKTVSRKISGVDSRVIFGAKEDIVYIWGIYKNTLIIAGSKDDFSHIIDSL